MLLSAVVRRAACALFLFIVSVVAASCGSNTSGPTGCNSGYTGDGGSCTSVTCAAQVLTNGTVTPAGDGMAGTAITYACNSGYTLSGQSTSTCQAGGTWSGTEPSCMASGSGCTPDPCVHSAAGCMATGSTGYSCGTCVAGWMGTNCDAMVTCTGAVAPANGTVSSSSAAFGDSITFACNAGYTLAGTAMATCQANAMFSSAAPSCTPNACMPDLTAPANGNVAPTMGTTGTVATYSCNGGYALSGSATRTCQADGGWSGAAATCTQVTGSCMPDPCVHSVAGCMPAGSNGYTCGTCVAGWSGTNCDVPVTCTGATAPTNGSVSSSMATFGNAVTYSCNTGFTLTGTAMATCQADGMFATPAPTCTVVDCGTPPTVTNAGAPAVSGGVGGGSTTTYGATAAYTCNSTFTKMGADPTCTATGAWGTAPTCVASTCGTYTDVIYRTTATFAITKTPLGLGDQTFTGLTTNASTPTFAGAGDATPFSRPPPAGGTTFTNGYARLRFTNDAAGNPIAGTVSLVEWYIPFEFTQTAGANLSVNVDHSVGLFAPGLSNCGGGDAACTNHAPTLQRSCTANAQGTLSGTTLTWASCTPAPTMMNSWSFANARAVTGAGCAAGYNAWGNITCNSGCALVPAAGLGDSFQTWNQVLSPFTFSSTTIKTATFTMPAMQIPNGTGQSTVLISITASTVLTTQCGSTPGTDLVCNIQ
jgi:hypothetical protein